MKTKGEKTQAAIRRDIIQFLNATSGRVDPKPGPTSCGIRHRNSLVLATCSAGTPRATVLEFFNEGMTLYIFGEPGAKIANIKRNPAVSAVVYEQPLDHGTLQKSLQIFGRAELITATGNPRLFWSKIRKWRMDAVGKKIMSPMFKTRNVPVPEIERLIRRGLESLSVIKIIPERVILKQWNPDFSMQRYEWKKKAS